MDKLYTNGSIRSLVTTNTKNKSQAPVAWENSPDQVEDGYLETRQRVTCNWWIFALKGRTELNNHFKMFRRFIL